MIELRCLTKLHGKVDPEITYEVKCRSCSRKFDRAVFHLWTIEQILDAQRRGLTVVYPRLEPELPDLQRHHRVRALEHPRRDREGNDQDGKHDGN